MAMELELGSEEQSRAWPAADTRTYTRGNCTDRARRRLRRLLSATRASPCWRGTAVIRRRAELAWVAAAGLKISPALELRSALGRIPFSANLESRSAARRIAPLPDALSHQANALR